MAGLLVSVRDVAEAKLALTGGAGLIDLKEPHAGSLGATDWHVWHAVHELCQAQGIPMSVALGELAQDNVCELARRIPAGTRFAKCGLSQMGASERWSEEWCSWNASLPQGTDGVLVHYADVLVARSPTLEAMLTSDAGEQARVILVDTFAKTEGGLLSFLSLSQLDLLRKTTAAREQLLVLAGSLGLDDLPVVEAYFPDWIAVRGAVCAEARTGNICEMRVARWSQAVRSMRAKVFENA